MKFLFFDIDGTLVSFKTHRVPQSTLEALRAAKRRGHKIIIATGRPKAIITNLAPLQRESLIDGYVTMNGAYCFCGDNVLHKSAIPAAEAKAIARRCEQLRVPCIFVHEHEMTIAGGNELSHNIFSVHLNAPEIPPSDYAAPLSKPIYQITPFLTEAEERPLLPLTPQCEYGRWHPAFIDVTRKGNTKAHGIDIIINHFGASLADTVAFGDGGNDTPMLRHAAVGVAMGNAADDVKRHADIVTTTVDDDGIRNALARLSII